MPRVKRGNVRTKKRRAVLSQTKGYMWGRKNLIKQAKTANHDLSYSKIIHLFKSKNIALDRKILADLAVNEPALFTKMIELIGKPGK